MCGSTRYLRGLVNLAIAGLLLLLLATIALGNTTLWIAWTRLGDEEFYMVAAIIVYYALQSIKSGIAPITAVLLSGALNVILKYTFNTPRPENPLVEVYGPGFPSGHAQVSTSFWSSLTLITRSKHLAILSAIIVTGVSLSRIYLRAHYELDIIGGIILGVAVGYVSFALYKYSTKGKTSVLQALGALLAAVIALYNMFVLNVEHRSMSAITGISLASLTLVLVAGRHTLDTGKTPLVTRMILCFLSIILLLGVHLVTRELVVYARITGFYVAGLIVLFLPVVIANSVTLRARRLNTAE
ncbi:MAG: phosphatase PAP2 family protein [Desulfurococcaceae archaeon]